MIESVITAKSQTTLPKGVRNALDLHPGDRLAYRIEHGRAIIMKAGVSENDPVVDAFLAFLERDMRDHPDRLQDLPAELIERARALVSDVAIDLDAPIDGDVAI